MDKFLLFVAQSAMDHLTFMGFPLSPEVEKLYDRIQIETDKLVDEAQQNKEFYENQVNAHLTLIALKALGELKDE